MKNSYFDARRYIYFSFGQKPPLNKHRTTLFSNQLRGCLSPCTVRFCHYDYNQAQKLHQSANPRTQQRGHSTRIITTAKSQQLANVVSKVKLP